MSYLNLAGWTHNSVPTVTDLAALFFPTGLCPGVFDLANDGFTFPASFFWKRECLLNPTDFFSQFL